MNRDLDALMNRVREKGVRVTRQRAIILETLCELDGHAGAEKLYRQIALRRGDVDLSTVYRTLEKLCDLKLVSRTDLGRGCTEYEVVADKPHHHLICQACGQVLDLDHAYLTPMAKTIQQDFHFEPILNHLAVFGLCQLCREKEQDS
jgi:Fur family ferric uptake transcriptional regulator